MEKFNSSKRNSEYNFSAYQPLNPRTLDFGNSLEKLTVKGSHIALNDLKSKNSGYLGESTDGLTLASHKRISLKSKYQSLKVLDQNAN